MKRANANSTAESVERPERSESVWTFDFQECAPAFRRQNCTRLHLPFLRKSRLTYVHIHSVARSSSQTHRYPHYSPNGGQIYECPLIFRSYAWLQRNHAAPALSGRCATFATAFPNGGTRAIRIPCAPWFDARLIVLAATFHAQKPA